MHYSIYLSELYSYFWSFSPLYLVICSYVDNKVLSDSMDKAMPKPAWVSMFYIDLIIMCKSQGSLIAKNPQRTVASLTMELSLGSSR